LENAVTKFISNLKLVYKLLIPVSVLVAVSVGIVWYAAVGLGSLNREIDDLSDVRAARLASALETGMRVNSAANDMHKAILDRDATEMKGDVTAFATDARPGCQMDRRADRALRHRGTARD
jgi:hypothetical protein